MLGGLLHYDFLKLRQLPWTENVHSLCGQADSGSEFNWADHARASTCRLPPPQITVLIPCFCAPGTL